MAIIAEPPEDAALPRSRAPSPNGHAAAVIRRDSSLPRASICNTCRPSIGRTPSCAVSLDFRVHPGAAGACCRMPSRSIPSRR